jgi:succinate dehydrogenase / fumarate reductase cytochrome b subunit
MPGHGSSILAMALDFRLREPYGSGMVTAVARPSAPVFVRARLASLVSLLPLGVWTVVHLWHNLAVFEGAAAWQAAVTEYPHPLAQLATLVVVFLPLAMHLAWGIGRLLTTRPNTLRYGTFANLRYGLQRLSAIGVLLFLGAHVWKAALFPRLVEGHAEAFADIAHEMRFHTPTLVVYLLGTLGVAYHLANGISSFAMGWGLATSRRAVEKLTMWVALAFVALLTMSWAVIYGLYANAP